MSGIREIVLREAGPAEAPAIAALIHAAYAEYHGCLDPPSGAHAETPETIRARMAAARVVVARVDDVLAGCVFLELREGHLYLSRLAVLPDFRRRGIGRALMARAEDDARAAHLAHVRLGVRLALTANRSYYERLGYRPVEYRAHPGCPEPTYAVLEKELKPN